MIIIINGIVITRVIGACSSDSLGASNGHESRPTDKPTDRQDRPDETRTDRPTRPSPKTTPRKYRHCAGKHAPRARPQNPSCLDTKMADKKKARVSCTSGGGFKNHRPLPPGAGQKPVPHLYPYSVGWEARRPLEPHSQPRRGRGVTCKKNVWPQSQKQRPRDKRVRAEDLKASSPCATRHQTRERKTQAAPKNRKKTMAPRPLGAQNKVCES